MQKVFLVKRESLNRYFSFLFISVIVFSTFKTPAQQHELSFSLLALQQKESPFFPKTNLLGVEGSWSYKFWKAMSFRSHVLYSGGKAKTDLYEPGGEFDMYLLEADFSLAYKLNILPYLISWSPVLGGGLTTLDQESNITSLAGVKTGTSFLAYQSSFILIGSFFSKQFLEKYEALIFIKSLYYLPSRLTKEMFFNNPSASSDGQYISEHTDYKGKWSLSVEPQFIWWFKKQEKEKNLGLLCSIFYSQHLLSAKDTRDQGLNFSQLTFKLGLRTIL